MKESFAIQLQSDKFTRTVLVDRKTTIANVV